jgi:hypothetical protein
VLNLEGAIISAIEKKIERGNEKAILLVYVELQIHRMLTEEEEIIRTVKRRCIAQFHDMAGICKGKLYLASLFAPPLHAIIFQEFRAHAL